MNCSRQEAATAKLYIQLQTDLLLLLLLLRCQNEGGVCKESCVSSSGAKADTERKIWGLASGHSPESNTSGEEGKEVWLPLKPCGAGRHWVP